MEAVRALAAKLGLDVGSHEFAKKGHDGVEETTRTKTTLDNERGRTVMNQSKISSILDDMVCLTISSSSGRCHNRRCRFFGIISWHCKGQLTRSFSRLSDQLSTEFVHLAFPSHHQISSYFFNSTRTLHVYPVIETTVSLY